MSPSPCRWLLPAVAAVAWSAAQAQTAPRPAALPDPLDAQSAVPALLHRSTLDSYRRLAEAAPLPWREANETVGRIGGWRAYAREATEPSPADRRAPSTATAAQPAAPASAPSAPAAAGPAGHGHHGRHKTP